LHFWNTSDDSLVSHSGTVGCHNKSTVTKHSLYWSTQSSRCTCISTWSSRWQVRVQLQVPSTTSLLVMNIQQWLPVTWPYTRRRCSWWMQGMIWKEQFYPDLVSYTLLWLQGTRYIDWKLWDRWCVTSPTTSSLEEHIERVHVQAVVPSHSDVAVSAGPTQTWLPPHMFHLRHTPY